MVYRRLRADGEASLGSLTALQEKRVFSYAGARESIKRALQRRVCLRSGTGPWFGIKPT